MPEGSESGGGEVKRGVDGGFSVGKINHPQHIFVISLWIVYIMLFNIPLKMIYHVRTLNTRKGIRPIYVIEFIKDSLFYYICAHTQLLRLLTISQV